MYSRLFKLLLPFASALLLSACPAKGGGQPVMYPPTWPLSWLTVPSGATRGELPNNIFKGDPGLGPGDCYLDKYTWYDAVTGAVSGYQWVVGFTYDGSWDTAEEQFRSQIRTQHYLVEKNSYSKGHSLWAWSRDGGTSIHLYRSHMSGKGKSYHLSVQSNLNPQPPDMSRMLEP